jgi:hypothetical protein
VLVLPDPGTPANAILNGFDTVFLQIVYVYFQDVFHHLIQSYVFAVRFIEEPPQNILFDFNGNLHTAVFFHNHLSVIGGG